MISLHKSIFKLNGKYGGILLVGKPPLLLPEHLIIGFLIGFLMVKLGVGSLLGLTSSSPTNMQYTDSNTRN